MIFGNHWRRWVERMIRLTPGIGNVDEATNAILRSEAAKLDSYQANEMIRVNAGYLNRVVKANHFRDVVLDAVTVRKQTP